MVWSSFWGLGLRGPGGTDSWEETPTSQDQGDGGKGVHVQDSVSQRHRLGGRLYQEEERGVRGNRCHHFGACIPCLTGWAGQGKNEEGMGRAEARPMARR